MFAHVYCLCLKESSWVGFLCYKNKHYLIILEDEQRKRKNLGKKKKTWRATRLGLEAIVGPWRLDK